VRVYVNVNISTRSCQFVSWVLGGLAEIILPSSTYYCNLRLSDNSKLSMK